MILRQRATFDPQLRRLTKVSRHREGRDDIDDGGGLSPRDLRNWPILVKYPFNPLPDNLRICL